MPKEYIFEFNGTKEELLNKLNVFPNTEYSDGIFYYFDDYIVKFIADEIHFGVERTGHSGGQWFISTIKEQNGKLELKGTIKYVGPKNDSTTAPKSMFKRCIDKIGEYLLYIIVTPVVLIIYAFVKIFAFFQRLVNKILHRPTAKPKTTEEKLFDLMERYLGCIRKEIA